MAPVISVSAVLVMSAARDSAGRAEVGGLRAHPVELVLGQRAQDRVRTVRHGRHHDQVAQPLEQVLDEPARVVAGLDHPVDDPEDRGAVARRERVDHVVEQRAVGVAEQRDRVLVGQPLGGRPGDQLVQHRERVAHRAGARPDDERQHALADLDPLLGAQLRQVVLQLAPAARAGTGSGGCASGWCR